MGCRRSPRLLGGTVAPPARREYGLAEVETTRANPLLPEGKRSVWMSHGDRIERLSTGLYHPGNSTNSPFAAIGDLSRHIMACSSIQKSVTPRVGMKSCADLRLKSVMPDRSGHLNRLFRKPSNVSTLRWAEERVLSAVSGGVDSSVATTLVHRAVGDQLVAVFVDNGLLRQGEAAKVVKVFQEAMGVELVAVDAVDDFINALHAITDPEQKRRIIGEKFIRIFETQARQLGTTRFSGAGNDLPGCGRVQWT